MQCPLVQQAVLLCGVSLVWEEFPFRDGLGSSSSLFAIGLSSSFFSSINL